jgi:hypothetical protein
MDHPSNMPDSTNPFQYFFALDQSRAQQHDYNPLFSSPSFTTPDSTCSLDIKSGPPFKIYPPTATTQLVSQMISFDMPSTTTLAVNQSNASSSANMGRNGKTHLCYQCGKGFSRRVSAEGCENRHLNIKPFQCERRCGDPNW